MVNSGVQQIDKILNDEALQQAITRISEIEQRKILTQFFGVVKPTKRPSLIHMAGIPGSGKSSCSLQLYEQHGSDSMVLISFDAIMESLEGYRNEQNSVEAFAKWELPARALGYDLLKRCISAHLSVLLDHSAANHAHLELLQIMGEEGVYHMSMVYMEATPQQVLPGVTEREIRTGRHTPPGMIYERSELLQNMMPQYEKIVHQFERKSIFE